MSSPSNLYAENIFAEHPQILWALDDKADYVSLIPDANRDTLTWTIDGGTSQLTEDFVDAPFPDSVINKITVSSVTSEFFSVSLISPTIVNLNQLNETLKTFSIGSYFYTTSPYALSVEIGYRYYDSALEEYVDVLKSYEASIKDKWFFISETFSPEEENSTIQLLIKFNFLGQSSTLSDYDFYINGISIGQWAEEFQSTSLGVDTIDLPSSVDLSINLTDDKVIEADAYGLSVSPGYYFVNKNSLVAKNFGVSLVFGSQNVTKIYNNQGKPSIIVPSLGMMSESGRYKEFTLEFWIRANNSSSEPKRIIGPIGSSDGIYFDGPFLILKIDNNYGSYYIGQWERPMLIDWRYANNMSSVLINGEEVISINFNSELLSLQSDKSATLKDKNWIGFYAYQNIEPIEIDCVAIYPYMVPSLVAKRRFVFGQGVQFPENLNASYGGSSVVFDYPFADYTKNYSYPNLGSWTQASLDNVIEENGYLTIPNVQSPAIVTNSLTKKQSEMLEDCNAINNPVLDPDLFLRLKPNSTWNSTDSYLYFDTFSLINQGTSAFYGLFKKDAGFSGTQVLMRLEDQNSNYFSIECVNNDVNYILKYGENAPEIIYQSVGVPNEKTFPVGIITNTFKNYYGENVAQFFANESLLKMYVGGTKDFEKTFTGKIYKVALCSEKNMYEIQSVFNVLGVPKDYENIFNLYGPGIDYDGGEYDREFWDYYIGQTQSNEDELDLISPTLENFSFCPSCFIEIKLKDHDPSLGITPKKYFDSFYIDASVRGSWKDYIPLSYFGQYVSDEYDNKVFDLDFIQFNINYPAPTKFKETETIDADGWTYEELSASYSYPEQRTYESLDNYLFTGYINYEDLAEKSVKTYSYDTSDAIVKTYITFEYLEQGANAVDSYFVNTESVPKNGVVEPGSNWINTKYEVVDNVIIYPPNGIDFNDLAIRIHIEFNVDGINYHPIQIKNLELASQAFNYVGTNSIGTRFGTNVYPYSTNGYYFNYKSKNPFLIYKGSSPYLYLTRHSGIEIRGDYDPIINRGIAVPVNLNQSEDYEVMAMQSLIRFNGDFFPYAPTKLMQINSKNKVIKLYMVPNHPTGKRAKIYAIDGNSGELYDGISFYINGKIVKDPVININEWAMLGMGFGTILDFKSYSGSIMINGPIIFNSLSFYQTTNLKEIQKVENRPWARVKFSAEGTFEWDYWSNFFLWQGMLIQSSSSYYGVNPENVYKAYTGTNKIIVGDDATFSIQEYEYSIFKDVKWQSTISDAV